MGDGHALVLEGLTKVFRRQVAVDHVSFRVPHLMGESILWLATLPLALGGGVATYAMLTAGAAALLARREPDLLARALGEE